VPKGRPRVTTRGGFASTYTPKKTLDYERRVSQWARKAMNDQPLIEGACSLTVIFYFALPKSRPQYQRRAMRAGMLPCTNHIDLDNLAKSIKDALNGVVWVDDRQVTTLVAHKRWAEESSVLVRITPQGEPDGKA
jgi:Holliday junction resolvase RusA-like endonuclease